MKQVTIIFWMVLAAGSLVAQPGNSRPDSLQAASDSNTILQPSINQAGVLVSSPLQSTRLSDKDIETIAYQTNHTWSFAPSAYAQPKYPAADKTSLYFRQLNQGYYQNYSRQQKDGWLRGLAEAVLSTALPLIAEKNNYFYYSPY